MNHQSHPPLRTREQVRADFEAHGQSIAKWAMERGFATNVVYDVLAGRTQGRYGQAHQIAVALGLKPAPEQYAA